LGLNS